MASHFEDYFRAYPVVMMPDLSRKDAANYGGKIFLPPSALNKLTMLNIRYPMLFELTSEESGKSTHSGVLEFTAEEGRCYLPQWMMSTLSIEPGSLLKISNCDLPLGTYTKIEPQSQDFLEISDPKAVLESVLRNFTTLTVNDIIEISYNDHIYAIKVLELKPDQPSTHSVCVIETDLVTEFAPPVGYVEPDYKAMAQERQKVNKKNALETTPALQGQGSMARQINYGDILREAAQQATNFGGKGAKLSGKEVPVAVVEETAKIDLSGPPVPLRLPEGQLFFGFPVVPVAAEDEDEETNSTTKKVFEGQGQTLRASRKRKDKNMNHPALKDKARSPEFIEID
ncbi:unnamed protein product [Kuraishia capsulata CBS 1993]|uniref:Ubiquitin fusion degradation protein 1 n=1 Tax=Kuraishia capsulata CBS 1993 TaxID=1382522 RepID=W6MKF0_9ASCO|nr:uncharacterized protein KUCA_T00002810001 [Kuraishia capsulata CBS 1993]CDK26836.1 unnamed protein product [Kuraishia capsulata CBS 1993]